MDSNVLKESARQIYLCSKKKLSRGEVPIMLGVQGQLALLWDSVRRWNGDQSDEHLIDIASAALFAYATKVQESLTHEPEAEKEEMDEVVMPKPRRNSLVAVGEDQIAEQRVNPHAIVDGEEIDASQWVTDKSETE